MKLPDATIGLAGGMCSGKNTFADYLVTQYGIEFGTGKVVTSSDAAREYLRTNNMGEPTRDRTRDVAAQLRKMHGPHYMVDWALSQYGDDEGLRVISGIYTMPETERIHEVGGVVVALTTANGERQRRMGVRLRAGESDNSDFARLDAEDMHATETDQRALDVIRSADIFLHDKGLGEDYSTLYQSIAHSIFDKLGISVGRL